MSFKDIDSMLLLKKVIAIMEEKGFGLSNLDVTVNAEKPKLSPYIMKMRENIAAAFKVSVDYVSVKATTEEGLGLKGEGIGATCVLILEEKTK